MKSKETLLNCYFRKGVFKAKTLTKYDSVGDISKVLIYDKNILQDSIVRRRNFDSSYIRIQPSHGNLPYSFDYEEKKYDSLGRITEKKYITKVGVFKKRKRVGFWHKYYYLSDVPFKLVE